jgi:hypothetical protein
LKNSFFWVGAGERLTPLPGLLPLGDDGFLIRCRINEPILHFAGLQILKPDRRFREEPRFKYMALARVEDFEGIEWRKTCGRRPP